MDGMKRCSRCQQEKPFSEFWPRYDKTGGYRSRCKDCVREVNGQIARPMKTIPPCPPGMKFCTGCDQIKPLGAFSGSHVVSGRRCKTCVNAEHKERYPRVKDAQEAKRKEWRKKERVKARTIDQVQKAKYRAKQFGLQQHFTLSQWLALCERYGNLCLCCKEAKPLTVDHIVPLSKGGSNTIENVQALCLSCNTRKWHRTIDYRPKK